MSSNHNKDDNNKQRSYRAQQRWNKVVSHMAVYRAAAVAHEDIAVTRSQASRPARVMKHHPQHPEAQKRVASSLTEVVWAAKLDMGLREGMINSECAFFDVLDEMKVPEKLDLLMDAFDIKKRNRVDLEDLQTVLDALQMDGMIKNELPTAEKLMDIFSTSSKRELSKNDVESLVHGLAAIAIDCPFDDMCQLILRAVIFKVTGATLLDKAINMVCGQSKCQREHAMTEARMTVLFQALENNNSGYVYLKDVVKSLYRITEDMGVMERETLLLLGDKHLRKLDYELFSNVILNVTESFRSVQVADIANEITLAISTHNIDDEEIRNLFVQGSGNPLNDSVESFDSFSSSESCYKVHAATSRKTANLAAWMGFGPAKSNNASTVSPFIDKFI